MTSRYIDENGAVVNSSSGGGEVVVVVTPPTITSLPSIKVVK